ncbi:MAG: hypothetical protein JNL01_02480 [Bdellovibrionales bacterium]|nr:hypothetical protein [Bdellovibrionales bacterium]
MTLLLGLVALSLAPASLAQTPFSIDLKMLENQALEYSKTAKQMRLELAGDQPKTFKVDGVEYRGNYYRSGMNTDLYKIVRNGKTSILRIPQGASSHWVCQDYVRAIQQAAAQGVNTVEILDPGSFKRLAVEVEFVQDFESFGDVLREASENPEAPQVKKKLSVIREFVARYGNQKLPDFYAENIGITSKQGQMTVKLVDATPAEMGQGFYKATTPGNSFVGRLFEDVMREVEFGMDRKGNSVAAYVDRDSPRFKNLELIRDEMMKVAHPEQSVVASEARTPTAAVKAAAYAEEGATCGQKPSTAKGSSNGLYTTRTLGTAANLLSFAGILVPLFLPETNPFAGEPIGVSCEDAERVRGRLKCEWDSKINPLNNVVYCSKVTKVIDAGQVQFFFRKMQYSRVCEVVYDSVAFDVESGTGKSELRKMGVFESRGANIPGKNAAEILQYIKSKVKVTDSLIVDDVHFPSGLTEDTELRNAA